MCRIERTRVFKYHLKDTQENLDMSSPNEPGSFIDRNWQVLVILFGIAFVTLLVSFHPVTW